MHNKHRTMAEDQSHHLSRVSDSDIQSDLSLANVYLQDETVESLTFISNSNDVESCEYNESDLTEHLKQVDSRFAVEDGKEYYPVEACTGKAEHKSLGEENGNQGLENNDFNVETFESNTPSVSAQSSSACHENNTEQRTVSKCTQSDMHEHQNETVDETYICEQDKEGNNHFSTRYTQGNEHSSSPCERTITTTDNKNLKADEIECFPDKSSTKETGSSTFGNGRRNEDIHTSEQDHLTIAMTSTDVRVDTKSEEQISCETNVKTKHEVEDNLYEKETGKYERRQKYQNDDTFNKQYTREECCRFLDKAWKQLVEFMEPIPLLDEFRRIGFFQNPELRDIEECTSTSAANRQIISKVRAKGVNGYLKFKECLSLSKQDTILHILNKIGDHTTRPVSKQIDTSERSLSSKSKDLRNDLITFYMVEHSTLPLSPLLEETDATILEFYTQPSLAQVETGVTSNQSCTAIASYADLFFEASNSCKNIYIVSDAGYGKTSFAKRLVMAWCQAHIPQKANEGFFKKKDLETIQMFNFVFFVSLRSYSEVECTVENMIQDQLETCLSGWYTDKEVQEVLKNERCLVILDGLDEWSHPISGKCKRFTETPHRKVREFTTYLTTTRTWKLSLAKLRSVEIDKLVEITRLSHSSSLELIHNTIEHLNTRQNMSKSSRDFVELVEENNLEELATIPLTAMQLICLWYDGKHIGKSLCKIYSSIIEVLLQKKGMKTSSLTTDGTTLYDECTLCNKYKRFLLALGELSFYTLFGDEKNSIVFDRTTVDKYLSSEYLQFSFETGILRQWKVPGQLTRRCYSLSFLHKTYQEFFAALFIASFSGIPTQVNERISKCCCGLKSFLEKSKVFVFLSGMKANVLEDILLRLSQKLSTDNVVAGYRSCLPDQLNEYNAQERLKLLTDYQNLILECMSECAACQTTVPSFYLADIVLAFKHESPKRLCLFQLPAAVKSNMEGITSVSITYAMNAALKSPTDEDVKISSNCLELLCKESLPSLQYLHVRGNRGPRNAYIPLEINCLINNSTHTIISLDLESFSFKQEMASLILKLTNLESLRISNIKMDHRERENLIISLNGERLQKLKQLVLQNIKCYINTSSKYRLKMNLSKYSHLRCVCLRNLAISQLDLPAEGCLNYLCLDLKSVMCLNLSPLTSLQHLEIANLHVKEVDVSKNVKLKQIHLSNLKISFLDISSLTQLSQICLENVPLSELVVTKYPPITDLTLNQVALRGMKITNKSRLACRFSQRQTLSEWINLETLALSDLELGDQDLLLTRNVKSLRYASFKQVSMTMKVLRSFMRSADQCESLSVMLCDCRINESDEFRQFKTLIRSQDSYVVTKDTGKPLDEFCFTKKVED